MAKLVVFIDAEITVADKKIRDLGAVTADGACFHSGSLRDFIAFISKADFLCGHNIVRHDLKYIQAAVGKELTFPAIDTLYLSPLLFPKRPYHKLLKDDKIQVDELNNPVNDSEKAADLFYDELNAFGALPLQTRNIFYKLLNEQPEFSGFFKYLDFKPDDGDVSELIRGEYAGKLCANADIKQLVKNTPVELAYALAIIGVDDRFSITPPWLQKNYPKIENVVKCLRNTPCSEPCAYCKNAFDIHKELKEIFGFDGFRTYNGEPLQERAAQAAVDGKSLLAVFPTGGGKSITFQLPALMAGKATHGLTVVISPLQSLMKDQVDNLNERGITEAVTVNGLLDPIERANALERVDDGSATLLYISPEQLRSRTIERLLTSRNVVRFVIDEAHCFSAWGQDFRVDYLYIGDFIRELQERKGAETPIPVSCFTATAKQKVISDICGYFKEKLNLDLELFASTATRENLRYTVLYKETNEEKYNTLRNLVAEKDCSTIVYVSRTKHTYEIADKLTRDGFPAKPFNGKMDPNDKIANQEAFINDEVKIIVATSAFGMGVDKKDVKLVVHFDISSSLEDYVQEAGRAGRDPSINADCYVLYNDSDLDKHFILLNQTKLSISEIQQVWTAIKELTKNRPCVCCSPLEIARQAGWDDEVYDIETRVKTAVSALEKAGYVKRGRNTPHVYATSILAKDMREASLRIEQSRLFSEDQRLHAKRIIKALISSRSAAIAGSDLAESRVDYLADILGLTKSEVIGAINLMRQTGLLADTQDMSAYILASDTENKSSGVLKRFAKLENFLLSQLPDEGKTFNFKDLNESALAQGIFSSNIKNLRTLIYYHVIKNNIRKSENGPANEIKLVPTRDVEKLLEKRRLRIELCRFILSSLYAKARETEVSIGEEKPVLFSLVGLYNEYRSASNLFADGNTVQLSDVEDALLYLSKIGALRIEGGFLVLYNAMEINRLITDNRIRYKKEDYSFLNEFYCQKIRQIHIVGEFANLMVSNYEKALQFVRDYFQLDFRMFIAKYFKGDSAKEIDRNITAKKYRQIFGELSEIQKRIIDDAESKRIVVAAGPGSGKTRVLVHKLASLILMEDVKREQLLMLTFSRAAATEFKKRLVALIGTTANYVNIKTFHSYCFDLLGKKGNLENSNDAVKNAVELIRKGEAEQGKIVKSVLVLDEAQDMDENEFNLILALMQVNGDMRVIAVGDDDQNIFEFRGSDSKYMRSLIEEHGAVKYEMTENYRSKSSIVAFANAFASAIQDRMKSAPIKAVQSDEGKVVVTRFRGKNMSVPILRRILQNPGDCKRCVLTNTNDEALQIQGALLRNEIPAKLIQSIDRFNLYDLTEMRFFLKRIKNKEQSSVISDEIWNDAKGALFEQYGDSACIDICGRLIQVFEEANRKKYLSDFEEFVWESKLEDFYESGNETVFVSTIHKAKGREFDVVYMMLNEDSSPMTEAKKRAVYVGLTRAKKELYVYCNTDVFSQFHVPGVEFTDDDNNYGEPEDISLQLSHRDVVLDFFKGKKNSIFKLRSGTPLTLSDGCLFAEIDGLNVPVAKLSKACRDRLYKLQRSRYYPSSANVRFIVAWKGKEDAEETAVILPDIHLKRKLYL